MPTTAEDAIQRLVKAVMNSQGEDRDRLINKHAGTLRSEYVYQMAKKRIDELARNVRNLEMALARVREIMAANEPPAEHRDAPPAEPAVASPAEPAVAWPAEPAVSSSGGSDEGKAPGGTP